MTWLADFGLVNDLDWLRRILEQDEPEEYRQKGDGRNRRQGRVVQKR
jgi:hypothetical protein